MPSNVPENQFGEQWRQSVEQPSGNPVRQPALFVVNHGVNLGVNHKLTLGSHSLMSRQTTR